MADDGLGETMVVLLGYDMKRTWVVGVYKCIQEADAAMERAYNGYRQRNPGDTVGPLYYSFNIQAGQEYEEHQLQIELF